MPPLTTTDQLRLIARLYHEGNVKQPETATRLGLSQARVSRLLKQAETLGIAKTTVQMPPGVYADLEEQLEERSRAGRDTLGGRASGQHSRRTPRDSVARTEPTSERQQRKDVRLGSCAGLLPSPQRF